MLRQFHAVRTLSPICWKMVRPVAVVPPLNFSSAPAGSRSSIDAIPDSHVHKREQELREAGASLFPRIKFSSNAVTCAKFHRQYAHLQPDQSLDSQQVVLQGRISTLRIVGPKLFFLDLVQDGVGAQGLCNFAKMSGPAFSVEEFKASYRLLRRGDIVRLCGTPCRTRGGELSLKLSNLPQLLSPCLHILPNELLNRQTRAQNRPVDFLVNAKSAAILRLRSSIINHLRSYFLQHSYIEAQTPILAGHAGGAIARPFITTATEFPDRKISLRIAPELWLKRLVIGGFDKVFEIGPSFRNEGLDLHHNPEFTTCEFYRAYTDIEKLMHITENIFHSIQKHVQMQLQQEPLLEIAGNTDFKPPYPRIDFISSLESAMSCTFPNLTAPNALELVTEIVVRQGILITPQMSLPTLLDQLSAKYIEPRCVIPTFIINHPECLSPLSKSFSHPTLDQTVTARAELFINGREVVNTYEEENSPFEQRRKFIDQLVYQTGESTNVSIDEDYIEALEWGFPPTGGWGAGIDRLCMLMLGLDRIGDVLSFGTLRNVVAMNKKA